MTLTAADLRMFGTTWVRDTAGGWAYDCTTGQSLLGRRGATNGWRTEYDEQDDCWYAWSPTTDQMCVYRRV